MAGSVERDGVRIGCADVGDAELIDEQFGEFEDAGQEVIHRSRDGCVAQFARPFWGSDRGSWTRRRPRGRRWFRRPRRHVEEMAHQRHGFGVIAGVVVHLAAAGLGCAELDGVAEAFEHSHDGLAGFREKGVVITGYEQGDQHTGRKR